MTVQYEMFSLATLLDIRNAISSPVLESGRTRSVRRDGRMTGKSGPEAVHASLLAKQEKDRALMMSAISGPSGTTSSASAVLTLSLASRLQERLEGRGSTLYALTWKLGLTPSRRPFCVLRASARRISDTVSTGWPTPNANMQGGEYSDPMKALARVKGPHAVELQDVAHLVTGWATPATRDYRTPNHKTYAERGGGKKGEKLQNQTAHLIPGASLNGLPASMEKRGLLNPVFSLWLQGIPAMWASCAPREMRSTRSSRASS